MTSPGVSSNDGSYVTAGALELQREVAVMSKARDVAQTQAEGLIGLVKAAMPAGVGRRLNAYA
jgi:hypothetical protein